MSTFLLEIVTPEHVVFSQEVDSLTVRGSEGELGIMRGHIPLVTPLQVAPIVAKKGKETRLIAVHGGFIEVQSDKVIVLAESAELAGGDRRGARHRRPGTGRTQIGFAQQPGPYRSSPGRACAAAGGHADQRIL